MLTYSVVAAFLIVCAAYFLICRRLSLLFEWAFLAGFPAAVPFILLARRLTSENTIWRSLMKWVLLAVAFTAFYWSGVALLWLRY